MILHLKEDTAIDTMHFEKGSILNIDSKRDINDSLLTGVGDTEINDKILIDMVFQIYKMLKEQNRLDFIHTIPYLGGSNKEGTKFYIDINYPQYFSFKDKDYDVWPLITFHEYCEWLFEINTGLPYQLCHQLALRNEYDAVKAIGIDIKVYDDFSKKWIKFARDERLNNIPEDLWLKPYEDEKDFEYIQQRMNRNI
jgi:hypothetical protein